MGKKVWMDLVKNKSKTIAIMVTFFVGLLAVGIVVMFSAFMVPEVNRAYYSAQPYDGLIKSEDFDTGILREVETLADVKEVDGRKRFLVRLDTGGQILNCDLVVLGTKNTINIVARENGAQKLPEPGVNEILIERAAREEVHKRPGDKVRLILNGNAQHELVLKDFVYDAVTEPYTIEGDVVAFINRETLKNLTHNRSYNQVMIKVKGDHRNKDHNALVVKRVADFMEAHGIGVDEMEVPAPGVFYATQALKSLTILMALFGSLAILLGVLLVINILNSMLAQHINQIGVMKAIGGSIGQISAMYLGMVLSICMITFVITLPVSAFIGYKVCDVLAGMLNVNLPEFRIPFVLAGVQFVAAVIVPLIATLVPVMKVTGTTVYDALNDNIKGKSYKDIPFLRIIATKFKYVSPRLLVSLRNNFRNRLRVLLTLATLVLSGTILITTFNLHGSFNTTIEEAKFLIPDGVLTLCAYEDAGKVERIAKGVSGVRIAEGWAFSQGCYLEKTSKRSKKVRIIGPKPESQLFDYKKARAKLIAGRLIRNDASNEIVISNHLTDYYPDLKVGNTVNLKINDRIYGFKVVGILALFGRPADPVLVGGYRFLNRIYGGDQRICDLRFASREHTDEYQTRVAGKIEQKLNQRGILVKERNLGAAMLEQFTITSTITIMFLMFLAIMVALIGAIGLSGTLSLNVLERTKELGIMRTIGGDNRKLNTMIVAEGTILVLAAWILSMVFSLPLTAVLNNVLGESLFAIPLVFQFDFNGVGIWLAILVLASFLAGILPCRKMNKMATQEALMYE